MENGISQEKLDWMNEVGIKEFKKPMRFYSTCSHDLYSEDYIKSTPLEELKAGYEKRLPVDSED